MAVELFANVASTTVSSGGTDAPVSGTVETWTVASSTGFPTPDSGASPPTQFHVSDPDFPSEQIAVTNISGDTWTVTRGSESTTPVQHAAGFTVFAVTTAGGLGSFLQSANNLSDVASPGSALSNLGGLPLAGGTMSGAIAMGSHKITGGSAASAGTDVPIYSQTPAGGAVVSGQYLCSPSVYAPASQTIKGVSGTAMAALYSTSINTGSFTAPPSGEVVVEASFMSGSGSGTFAAFGLAPHGSVSPIVGAQNVFEFFTSDVIPVALRFYVPGLNSGSPYNFDLLAAASTGAVNVYAGSQSSTTPTLSGAGVGAPVVMTVQAV